MPSRDTTERLIYGHEFAGRFTQDSPVLPDVWITVGAAPIARHPLLLTPNLAGSGSQMNAGRLSCLVRERLAREAETKVWQRLHPGQTRPLARVAYNQSTVAADLTFAELVRVVLPLSKWWHDRVFPFGYQHLLEPGVLETLAAALVDPPRSPAAAARRHANPWLSLDALWMVRVVGALGLAAEAELNQQPPDSLWPTALLEGTAPATAAADLPELQLADARRVVSQVAALVAELVPPEPGPAAVYVVSRNRPARSTVWRSTMAVKADAARRVFDLSCRDLTWAVIDSGIDARHPAFRKRYVAADTGAARPLPLTAKVTDDPLDQPKHVRHEAWRKEHPEAVRQQDWTDRTRVVGTYDFTLIRHLLATGDDEAAPPDPALAARLKRIETRLAGPRHEHVSTLLRTSLQSGRELDWSLLAELLRVPHGAAYEVPAQEHGTHVAGIIGADWRQADGFENFPAETDVQGLCPDINLYDLRVLDEAGDGDEFTVMAALQFVRSLNAHKDYQVVHGANLSLSIPHEVANYACGRTPVCEECERLVGARVVVVAAAGNEGYLQYLTPKGSTAGYRGISITDPGNAEGVITVGATHRDQPHTYGVSYFSSRGPTADGRAKPDLVAPGEKIESPVPNGELKRLDGTSMAAAHVSGAAALLLARHRELAGRPAEVKDVLCRAATNLGRERYFQGAGMLDILRALQSV